MLKKEILRRNSDFSSIYKKGKSVGDRFVVLFFRKNKLPYNRIAFLASKKVGNSVTRNRARRLMKESYRQICDELAVGYDIIFIARKTIINTKYADVKKSIEAAARRAGILKRQPKAAACPKEIRQQT
ncbi:MAG: ribonuclease P protein component [Firmicutes bacterium]|nr:ribonuclease P protein component [Bacillota bacterium]